MSDQGSVESDLLYFNGIDGTTGSYLIPPMPAKALARIALRERWDPKHLQDLELKKDRGKTFALEEGRDANNLAQAGWGVIFAAEADPHVNAAIHEALGELLNHRKTQAGPLYREFIQNGFYRTESKDDFLRRHKASPGPVDPTKLPFYLLIVGDPQSIPYRFQYELDVAYAVGRIHFDTLDEYAQYARSVVLAETPGNVALPRCAAFAGVANPDDQATQRSAKFLITPLVESLQRSRPSWDVQQIPAAETTKSDMLRLLGGDRTPALVFTASHGMGFPNGDSRQYPYQGALLCQDWPGPEEWYGRIPRDHYLAAEDIKDDARLLGTIVFHFACYGAGTPYWDDFARQAHKTRVAIAPHAFSAALPQRLLSHPKGGALAVVGHIERAWTYSFSWKGLAAQTGAFESTLKRLMGSDGSLTGGNMPPQTIGWALDWLNIRYAEIATMLSNDLEQADIKKLDPIQITDLWTAHNDARGYGIVGDPAVRLSVVQGAAAPHDRAVIPAIAARAGCVPRVLVPEALTDDQATIPQPAISGTAGGAAAAPPAFTPLAGTSSLLGEEMPRTIQEKLATALGQLSAALTSFAQPAAPLEVSAYVTGSVESTTQEVASGQFSGRAALRALTVIEPNGNIKLYVPSESGLLDQELRELYASLVQQAQQNRVTMLKTAAEALAVLAGIKME